MPAGEEVNVKMRHGFARVGAVVDHEPEAFGETEFLGDVSGDDEEVPQNRLVGGVGGGDAWDQLFRHDEEMHRRLWVDVVEDDAVFVLVFDPGRDFTIDDAFENGLRHDVQMNRKLARKQKILSAKRSSCRQWRFISNGGALDGTITETHDAGCPLAGVRWARGSSQPIRSRETQNENAAVVRSWLFSRETGLWL